MPRQFDAEGQWCLPCFACPLPKQLDADQVGPLAMLIAFRPTRLSQKREETVRRLRTDPRAHMVGFRHTLFRNGVQIEHLHIDQIQ